LLLRDVPLPTPGPGQVRVRVSCCGVCHTDLHIVEGDLAFHKKPVIPGHQVVGVVDAVGSSTNMFKEGDRAGIVWLHSTDATCAYCRSGRENLCDNARFTGYDVDGGYAEAVVVPEAFAYRLPARFADEHAAPLLCAGVIGYRAFRLSGAQRGQRLGLYGFGASAHIVLQVARHLGCEVHVFTRAQAHRKLASRLGATFVGDARDAASGSLDAAIMFAPAGPLVPESLRALRKGGTVALAGITMTPIPQMDYGLIYHERALRSVANSTRQDARELLEIAADIPVETSVTMFSLEQANAAIAAMKHSQIEGAAVLRARER
ncbi:MAG: zinc-dependent alcohol dehydrogenase family protein, partial [Acidobacteriaceae bacterium]|nr:zinc-dependent alcohol dehydrogenase family protein [Acidobacteriaceae bacterium]